MFKLDYTAACVINLTRIAVHKYCVIAIYKIMSIISYLIMHACMSACLCELGSVHNYAEDYLWTNNYRIKIIPIFFIVQ